MRFASPPPRAVPVSAALIVALAAALGGCTTPNIDSSTVVEVDGVKQDGAEFANAGCTREGDSILVGSGSAQNLKGIAVTLTDGNPPTLNHLSIIGAGLPLTINTVGMNVGSGTVSRAGNRYTITGKARASDLTMRDVRVAFTCS